MKRKNILVAGAALGLSTLTLSAISLANSNVGIMRKVTGEESSYSINLFDAIKNNVDNGTATINTDYGNPIVLNFHGLSLSNDKIVFADDAYIVNATPITGLQSISTDFVGAVSYWNKDAMVVIHDVVDSGSLVFDPDIVASIFKLENPGGNKQMSSLSMVYKCDHVEDNGSIKLGFNSANIEVDSAAKSFHSVGTSATLTLNATLARGHVRYKQNNNGASSNAGLCFNLDYSSSYFWEKATGASYFETVFKAGRVYLSDITPADGWTWETTSNAELPGYSATETYTIDVYFDIAEGFVLATIDGFTSLRYTIPEENRYLGNKLGFRIYDGVLFSDIEIFKDFSFDYESSFNETETEEALPSEWGNGPYGLNEKKYCSNGELVIGNTAGGIKSALWKGNGIDIRSSIIEADVRLIVGSSDNSAFGFAFSSSSYDASTGASTQINYVKITRGGLVRHCHYFSKIGSDYADSDYVSATGEKNIKSGTSLSASNHPEIYNAIRAGEKIHIVAGISGRNFSFFANGVMLLNSTIDSGVDNYRALGFYSVGNYSSPGYSNVKIMNL